MNNANIIATSNKTMEVAAFMVAKSNGNINPILLGAKLAMIAELKKRLAKGEIVEFDFVKKGASTNGVKVIRHAVGCLYGTLIEPRIKGTGVHNSIYGNLTYWDLERNAFRCCSYETICKVY
jgi:hypothetical protein